MQSDTLSSTIHHSHLLTPLQALLRKLVTAHGAAEQSSATCWVRLRVAVQRGNADRLFSSNDTCTGAGTR